MSSINSVRARMLVGLIAGFLSGGGVMTPASASCADAAAQDDMIPMLIEQLIQRHGWRPGICRLVEPDEQQAFVPKNSSLAIARALEQQLQDRPITALGTRPRDKIP